MKYPYFQITTNSRKRRGRVRTTNRGSQKMSTWFRLQNLKTVCWLYLFLFTVSIKFFPFELNHSNFSAPWLLHVMLNESNNIEKKNSLWKRKTMNLKLHWLSSLLPRENLMVSGVKIWFAKNWEKLLKIEFFREKD